MLTNVAAMMMDGSAGLRKFLFDKVISDALPLPELLADDAKLERHVRDNVQSAWHPSCTCRMGDPADAADGGGSARQGGRARRTCSSPMRR